VCVRACACVCACARVRGQIQTPEGMLTRLRATHLQAAAPELQAPPLPPSSCAAHCAATPPPPPPPQPPPPPCWLKRLALAAAAAPSPLLPPPAAALATRAPHRQGLLRQLVGRGRGVGGRPERPAGACCWWRWCHSWEQGGGEHRVRRAAAFYFFAIQVPLINSNPLALLEPLKIGTTLNANCDNIVGGWLIWRLSAAMRYRRLTSTGWRHLRLPTLRPNRRRSLLAFPQIGALKGELAGASIKSTFFYLQDSPDFVASPGVAALLSGALGLLPSALAIALSVLCVLSLWYPSFFYIYLSAFGSMMSELHCICGCCLVSIFHLSGLLLIPHLCLFRLRRGWILALGGSSAADQQVCGHLSTCGFRAWVEECQLLLWQHSERGQQGGV